MRPRVILILSIGLNIAIAIAWVYTRRHAAAPGIVVAEAPATNDSKPRYIVSKQYFSWEQLESPDYAKYIANLRSVGCPEQTIRDIILADVNALYSKRRLTEILNPEQQWWRSQPDPAVVQAAKAKLDQLNRERRDLLTKLLGPGWEFADASESLRSGLLLNGPLLGDLPDETRMAVQDINARAQEEAAAYVNAQESAGKSPDPAEMARLRLQTRQELAKVLTPAQLEEFLLRYSDTASSLRESLHGIELPPDQFRNLFRTSDPIDMQLQLDSATNDPATVQQRADLQKERDDAFKDTLGASLYQQYQLANDSAYQDALAAVEQAGAPPETVTNLYALNQAANQEINRINSDTNLTADQKNAQIQAVQNQQQTASDQLLGLTQAAAPQPESQSPASIMPPGFVPTQVHSYAPGETVDMIAAQSGASVQDIMALNQNVNWDHLSPGQPILVPKR